MKMIRAHRARSTCISNPLESIIPRHVINLSGRKTNRRCKYATVFVDHVAKKAHVHFQESTNAAETVKTKVEFEKANECAYV